MKYKHDTVTLEVTVEAVNGYAYVTKSEMFITYHSKGEVDWKVIRLQGSEDQAKQLAGLLQMSFGVIVNDMRQLQMV